VRQGKREFSRDAAAARTSWFGEQLLPRRWRGSMRSSPRRARTCGSSQPARRASYPAASLVDVVRERGGRSCSSTPAPANASRFDEVAIGAAALLLRSCSG
jgi:hypothetical protein